MLSVLIRPVGAGERTFLKCTFLKRCQRVAWHALGRSLESLQLTRGAPGARGVDPRTKAIRRSPRTRSPLVLLVRSELHAKGPEGLAVDGQLDLIGPFDGQVRRTCSPQYLRHQPPAPTERFRRRGRVHTMPPRRPGTRRTTGR